MSINASHTSDGANGPTGPGRGPLGTLAHLLKPSVLGIDMYLLIATLPLFLVFSWPLLGWVATAAIWVGQRLLQVAVMSRVKPGDDPKKVLGLTGIQILTRGWGAMLAVMLVGAYDKTVGLAAAIMIIALFSAYFAQKLLERYSDFMPGTDKHPRPGSSASGDLT